MNERRLAEYVFEHGPQSDDPVANESGCCFPCGYHSCVVISCLICDEMVVLYEDPDGWRHIDPPTDGHVFKAEPPEHWAWILENRPTQRDGSGAP